MALLEVRSVSRAFSGVLAVHKVSLHVDAGETVSIIGPNGAGKTTLFNLVAAYGQPTEGNIVFDGQSTIGQPADQYVGRGIALTFQHGRVFDNLSVEDNVLLMGAYQRRDRALVAEDYERMLLLFPRLNERIQQRGGTLSGGEQQMLAIGRALMGRPQLICMDEPAMGLSPLYVDRVLALIQEINSQGYTIFMVEQNANLALQIAHLALQIAHRGYVLQNGRIVLQGEARSLLETPEIQDAYLGEAAEA